ncbi:MAG: hypothetical protein NXI25_18010 [bacterium]|nr:hypothetical protein [bacterium]
MAKEKKIGVKFFLNTRLKPKVLAGVNRYPVYSRVTFNRKNHQSPFEFKNTIDGLMSEGEFNLYVIQRSEPRINAEIKQFEKEVRAIIKAGYKIYGDDYSLSGLSSIHNDFKQLSLLFFTEFKTVDLLKDYTKKNYPDEFDSIIGGNENIFPNTLYSTVSGLLKGNKSSRFLNWPVQLQYSIFGFMLFSSFSGFGFWNTEYLKLMSSDIKAIDWIAEGTKAEFIDYLSSKEYLNEQISLNDSDPFATGLIETTRLLKSITIDKSMVINMIDLSLFL